MIWLSSKNDQSNHHDTDFLIKKVVSHITNILQRNMASSKLISYTMIRQSQFILL